MQKILVCLMLVSFFYACTGNRPKYDAEKVVAKKLVKKDSTLGADTALNLQFKQFWKQFTIAVKNNDMSAVNRLTFFPIRNLHPCYLPTAGQTRSSDTSGLSSADFKKLNKKVFDDETTWLSTTPADSLYLYDKNEDDKKLPLDGIVDNKTPVYEYAVVYDQGRTGGSKSLYFGSVKGAYKLIWIECEGNVKGHMH